jgi:hypothetical protein
MMKKHGCNVDGGIVVDSVVDGDTCRQSIAMVEETNEKGACGSKRREIERARFVRINLANLYNGSCREILVAGCPDACNRYGVKF